MVKLHNKTWINHTPDLGELNIQVEHSTLYTLCHLMGSDIKLCSMISTYIYIYVSKAVELIDCHYMTDRLQRFELKILICVQLKKLSHLYLRCPAGGKQINITFSFLVNVPLTEVERSIFNCSIFTAQVKSTCKNYFILMF